MIKSTKDYDMFVLRADNREKIDLSHVRKLCESIKSRNLLEMRPIVVNKDMEVLDGQHRLMAAKQLGVEIYYQEEKKLEADDIIRMNISKAWGIGDYLNFYCHHEYPEYKKLSEFMKKHGLNLKVCLAICVGNGQMGHVDFKAGKFKFHSDVTEESFQMCWETVDYLKRMSGYCSYVYTVKFWRALLLLVRHPDFDMDKWRHNRERNITQFGPRARESDFVILFESVYNWRNRASIHLTGQSLPSD